MKLKYDFDCEKCKSKDICKYYTETSKYCKKELDVKLKPKEEASKENLIITINCKHYNSEESTLNYPYGVRGGFGEIPYINTNIETPETYLNQDSSIGPYSNPNMTISNSTLPTEYACSDHLAAQESSRNVSKIITTKKHI